MVMRLRVAASIVFALPMVFFSEAYSDPIAQDHGHKTPHGGILSEAEGMHAELLIDQSGQPKLYLYDKAMKPLGRGDFQARLVVKAHDSSQHTRDLKVSGDPKQCTVFRGEPIKGVSDWDTAVASLKLKDRWTHVRFSHH